MSTKATFIALALAILSAAYAAHVLRGSDAAKHEPGASRPLLSTTSLPVDDVNRITLKRRGEEPLVFERRDGAWMQVEPFAYPMDRYSMRQLSAVALLVQALDEVAVTDGVTEETLGLAPPEASLTYEWPAGSRTLQLGRRGIAGRAYLRVAGEDRVRIVTQELHTRAVEMNPKEWRDRTLFAGVNVEADRIERIIGADDRLVLERDRRQWGGWRMIEPAGTRVDREALDAYLQAMASARAGGFIADQPAPMQVARFGLTPPAASITLTGDVDGQLLVGSPIGAGSQDRYGMVEGRPVVLRLPAAVLAALFRHAVDLIDPTGCGVQAADVRAIRIQVPSTEDRVPSADVQNSPASGGGTRIFRIERDLERWRVPDFDRMEVPMHLVNELLAQLTELRATDVSIQDYPQELEAAVITLIGFDERPLDTVRVLRDSASDVWALENGDGVLRLFPGSMKMNLRPEDFGLGGIGR